MENAKMKQIGKEVGIAAGLATLGALSPYADEIIIALTGTLPVAIAPIVLALVSYLLRSPFSQK
jgi:hypothetical protein